MSVAGKARIGYVAIRMTVTVIEVAKYDDPKMVAKVARDWVKTQLKDIIFGDRQYDAGVNASELATNAIKHARSRKIIVCVSIYDESVKVSVGDQSGEIPEWPTTQERSIEVSKKDVPEEAGELTAEQLEALLAKFVESDEDKPISAAQRNAALDANDKESGRGLAIIREDTGGACGFHPQPYGKDAWFILAREPQLQAA